MTEELLNRIRPGMDLCSSDYKKWGDVEAVVRPPADRPGEAVISGRLDETGAAVYVPASAVLAIEGDVCVRVTAPLAEIQAQEWDQPPAGRFLPERALREEAQLRGGRCSWPAAAGWVLCGWLSREVAPGPGPTPVRRPASPGCGAR